MSVLGNNLLAEYYAQNQGLPYGYIPVAYLESTGTQWINPEICINSEDIRIIFDFAITTSFTLANSAFLFGSYENTYAYSVALPSRTALRVPTKRSFENIIIPEIQNERRYTVNYGWGDIMFNGQRITATSEYNVLTSSNTPMALFGRNSNMPNDKFITNGIRCFASQIINSELVRNFIPCIRLADGKPGMYDLCKSICPLTGTPFYINAGTGEFVTP